MDSATGLPETFKNLGLDVATLLGALAPPVTIATETLFDPRTVLLPINKLTELAFKSEQAEPDAPPTNNEQEAKLSCASVIKLEPKTVTILPI